MALGRMSVLATLPPWIAAAGRTSARSSGSRSRPSPPSWPSRRSCSRLRDRRPLGTAPLAGPGIAGAILSTLVRLCIFLAAWLAVTVGGSLTWLWVAFAVMFMGGRVLVLAHRSASEAWLRVGA
jgi:hypothetical protein